MLFFPSMLGAGRGRLQLRFYAASQDPESHFSFILSLSLLFLYCSMLALLLCARVLGLHNNEVRLLHPISALLLAQLLGHLHDCSGLLLQRAVRTMTARNQEQLKLHVFWSNALD